jgi:hypothetical protein
MLLLAMTGWAGWHKGCMNRPICRTFGSANSSHPSDVACNGHLGERVVLCRSGLAP